VHRLSKNSLVTTMGEVCSINAEMIGDSLMIQNCYIGGQVSLPRVAVPPLRSELAAAFIRGDPGSAVLDPVDLIDRFLA
jgi:hypothetical protein